MTIRASRFGALLDARLSLAEDTGIRYANGVVEGPLKLSDIDRRKGFWAGEVRRGVMECWALYHDRNDKGAIGLSVIFASNANMTANVTEIGPVYIPPSAPDGSLCIPISFAGTPLLDTSELWCALKFTASGEDENRPEIQVSTAFLCRRTA